jgi:hypothetical protein
MFFSPEYNGKKNVPHAFYLTCKRNRATHWSLVMSTKEASQKISTLNYSKRRTPNIVHSISLKRLRTSYFVLIYRKIIQLSKRRTSYT